MSYVHSFPAIADDISRRLILGSMPGKVSLLNNQYYAHPRNLFWDFMAEFFAIPRELEYSQRCLRLQESGIAVWDVLKCCTRASSLDSDIVTSSVVANDFEQFFRQHQCIEMIYFNGAKAEQIYHKYVLPVLSERFASIPSVRLPSTSPANASIPRIEKHHAWSVVAHHLG